MTSLSPADAGTPAAVVVTKKAIAKPKVTPAPKAKATAKKVVEPVAESKPKAKPVAKPKPVVKPKPKKKKAKPKSSCDPNYSGACVPIASDVDCAGGSGNGPAYFSGVATVIGDDIYDLDRDNDGYACESN
jgi:hypothetical protein